jgi:HTH-type transcriptional regulator / antitoxin HigA
MRPSKTNQYFPETVTHPGETLREKLEEIEMGSKEFAIRTGKPEKTISEVLNGNSSITPEMAVQFEKVLKIPANFWLRRQSLHDESIARQRQKQIIENAKEWARQFPYPSMVKCGWVSEASKVEEKIDALFNFFRISTHTAWEDYYLRQAVKAAFRISLKHAKSPYALSAWLQRGENQAREIQAPDYEPKKLKAILPEMKALMAAQPGDFFQKIKALCLQAGVKVVYTPALKGAPINGAARWIEGNTTPLIQLSFRYKRNDVFWFSFFHEIGHILLHGKKDIFLEDGGYDEQDMEKEQEADAFAVEWTLPLKQEATLRAALPLTDAQIRAFAREWGTHPGVVAGRLQHLGLVPHHEFAEFFVKVKVGEGE